VSSTKYYYTSLSLTTMSLISKFVVQQFQKKEGRKNKRRTRILTFRKLLFMNFVFAESFIENRVFAFLLFKDQNVDNFNHYLLLQKKGRCQFTIIYIILKQTEWRAFYLLIAHFFATLNIGGAKELVVLL
jgi:hypothetical protein